jgi:hypothetical protein
MAPESFQSRSISIKFNIKMSFFVSVIWLIYLKVYRTWSSFSFVFFLGWQILMYFIIFRFCVHLVGWRFTNLASNFFLIMAPSQNGICFCMHISEGPWRPNHKWNAGNCSGLYRYSEHWPRPSPIVNRSFCSFSSGKRTLLPGPVKAFSAGLVEKIFLAQLLQR